MIETNGTAAREHPLISEFMSLVRETVDGCALTFRDLQKPVFMKYWKNLIIYRYENNLNDFRVNFYGTHVARMYGADWTGKLLSEMGFAEAEEDVIKMNSMALNEDTCVYASGTLFWQGREHRIWHQVKLPLQRDGQKNEVLVCMDIA